MFYKYYYSKCKRCHLFINSFFKHIFEYYISTSKTKMDNYRSTNKQSWADIVKHSHKTCDKVQYVMSKEVKKKKSTDKQKAIDKYTQDLDEASTMETLIYQGPMTKETLFENIWCWGDYELLNTVIDILTFDEICFLIDSIRYKLQDIDSWSNPSEHHDRKMDIMKCNDILVNKKCIILKEKN